MASTGNRAGAGRERDPRGRKARDDGKPAHMHATPALGQTSPSNAGYGAPHVLSGLNEQLLPIPYGLGTDTCILPKGIRHQSPQVSSSISSALRYHWTEEGNAGSR